MKKQSDIPAGTRMFLNGSVVELCFATPAQAQNFFVVAQAVDLAAASKKRKAKK